ncbi:hypothetical protein GR7B_00168 [Vibrio phage vB_VcorM_GR7B]|nr:hypothetical protein GR7B_00168 [Vibrio phage vB_VcorM_GR7B]
MNTTTQENSNERNDPFKNWAPAQATPEGERQLTFREAISRNQGKAGTTDGHYRHNMFNRTGKIYRATNYHSAIDEHMEVQTFLNSIANRRFNTYFHMLKGTASRGLLVKDCIRLEAHIAVRHDEKGRIIPPSYRVVDSLEVRLIDNRIVPVDAQGNELTNNQMLDLFVTKCRKTDTPTQDVTIHLMGRCTGVGTKQLTSGEATVEVRINE